MSRDQGPSATDGTQAAPTASGFAQQEKAAIAAALANENMTLVQRISAVEAIRPPPRHPVGSRPRPGARSRQQLQQPAPWQTLLWACFWLVLIVTFWIETGAYRIILGLAPFRTGPSAPAPTLGTGTVRVDVDPSGLRGT